MFARKSTDLPPEIPASIRQSSSRNLSTMSRSVVSNVAAVQNPAAIGDQGTDGVVIIGKGTRIVGDITHCARLEIQGAVEGRISADILVVRDSGSMKGEIHASDAEINGSLEGQIDIKGLLDIRSTGRVEGELGYGKLAVAMGGHIAGHIKTSEVTEVPVSDGRVVSLAERASFISSGSDH